MKFQGICADITTPFDYKGDIYKAKVQHNVEKWNRTTLAGYVVCGSAGEGALLCSEERIAVWEMVRQFAASDKTLIAAAGAPGVRETVALCNRAADLGYQAAVVASTHRDPETRALYFRSVADQSKIPVIVNGEGTAGALRHPNIAAMCDGAGTGARDGTQVLAGSAEHLLSALQSGASAAILDFAAAAPYACIAIWEAFRTREDEAARDWQARIAGPAALIARYGVPVLKHAMDLHAYYGGPPRLPLVVPGAQTKDEVEAALRGLAADR